MSGAGAARITGAPDDVHACREAMGAYDHVGVDQLGGVLQLARRGLK